MALYIRRPQQAQVVEAELLGPASQAHPQGSRPGRPGDYLVTDHSIGQQFVLTAEEFAAQYEPMAVPATAMENTLRASNPNWNPQGPEGSAGPAQSEDLVGLQSRPATTPVNAPPPSSPPPGATGDIAPPTQPMTDQLPGRPSVAPEQRPRLESTEPVETPTGIPEQPGDADKAFHESEAPAEEAPPEHPPGWTPNPTEAPPPPGTF